ncbi:MAG: hypothetical protein IMZ61_08520 [Planctomycetes bacterium]|nr:hypothetical protein [Planctomycetota bacterium]
MTQLMNCKGVVPEPLFIFVNEQDPVTYNNFHVTGEFNSAAFTNLSAEPFVPKYIGGTARYLPFAPCEKDLQFLSPYFLTAINDYRVEYDCELYRKARYPLYPSRFSAIFAFGDYESCKAASKNYGWDLATVKEFTLTEHPLCRAVKVNMEHVSLARFAYRTSMMQNIEQLWEGYWTGFDNTIIELPTAGFVRKQFESGVIWEYLIEGKVKHIDQKKETK